jgi:hypothetical protein
MGRTMPVAYLQEYERTLKEKFQPFADIAKMLSARHRADVEAEMMEQFGVNDLIKELEAKLNEVKLLVKKGEGLLGENWAQDGYSKDFTAVICIASTSPFKTEMERRVKNRDGIETRIEEMYKECKRELWLQSAPAEVQAVFHRLDETLIPELEKMVSKFKKDLMPEPPKIKKLKVNNK